MGLPAIERVRDGIFPFREGGGGQSRTIAVEADVLFYPKTQFGVEPKYGASKIFILQEP